MASSKSTVDAASAISKLTIDPHKTASDRKAQKPKKKPVADSWEDEDVSSGDEDGDSRPSTSGGVAKPGTSAPPPTPVSPNYNIPQTFSSMDSALQRKIDADLPAKRPEKTDAVARRMISAALGVKAPKPTDEQKAYDKAIRGQERKRREEERAADKKKQEEAEKAKLAVWED